MTTMTIRQRQPRVENAAFLSFVRTHRCCVCGAPPPSQAAHLRMGSVDHGKRSTGAGEKPSDRWSTPLCAGCHTNGPQAQHRCGERHFWYRNDLDPFAIAIGLYKEFMAISKKRIPKSMGNPRSHGACVYGKISPEYISWCSMKARCLNKNSKMFRNYGLRGIKICERWESSFENFLADVGLRPSSEHSIGRIDNDGHYDPGNVEWQDKYQQARNKRNSISVTLSGKTMQINDACDIYKASPKLMRDRMERGWSPEKAFSEPKRGSKSLRSASRWPKGRKIANRRKP